MVEILNNTDVVVGIAFLLFIGVLIYFKVPGRIGGMLDERAEKIRFDLEEARKLREEAQALLAGFERRQKDVAEHADAIVRAARQDAEIAAEQAKKDLDASLARRIQAAKDQIQSAEDAAAKEIRDRAVAVAVAAAGDVIRERLKGEDAAAMLDSSIEEVSARLH